MPKLPHRSGAHALAPAHAIDGASAAAAAALAVAVAEVAVVVSIWVVTGGVVQVEMLVRLPDTYAKWCVEVHTRNCFYDALLAQVRGLAHASPRTNKVVLQAVATCPCCYKLWRLARASHATRKLHHS